jgi:hypothetical protein
MKIPSKKMLAGGLLKSLGLRVALRKALKATLQNSEIPLKLIPKPQNNFFQEETLEKLES